MIKQTRYNEEKEWETFPFEIFIAKQNERKKKKKKENNPQKIMSWQLNTKLEREKKIQPEEYFRNSFNQRHNNILINKQIVVIL